MCEACMGVAICLAMEKRGSLLFSNGCGVVVYTVTRGIFVSGRCDIQPCCQVGKVGVISKREEDGVCLQSVTATCAACIRKLCTTACSMGNTSVDASAKCHVQHQQQHVDDVHLKYGKP